MKVLVLVAGCLGAIGFFQPFFDYGDLPVSAKRIITGFTAQEAGLEEHRLGDLRELNEHVQLERGVVLGAGSSHRSPVPYYFLSAIVMVIVGAVSLIRGRFSGFAALFSLSAAMLALGGWLRELRLHRMLAPNGGEVVLSTGATLLVVSGAIALIASLVVLIKREPDPPPKPPEPPTIELPEARVVS